MVYHHELGRGLQTLGYELDWRSDGTFDVWGYSQSQLKEFSTRKQEIENAVGVEANAATKAQACTKTRRGKVYKAAEERETLKQTWQKQAELTGISHPKPKVHQLNRDYHLQNPDKQKELLNQVIGIVTERQVAAPKHIFLKEALRQSQGNYSLDDLEKEIERHKSLIKTQDGRLTTLAAINREKRIISLAKNGKDKYPPLANIETAHQQAEKLGLNKAQANALNHFVNNRDGVMLCQGDAGVGKTYTVKALKATISPNILIRGLAPSAAAASELNQGADINCQTLDAYLNIPLKSLLRSCTKKS